MTLDREIRELKLAELKKLIEELTYKTTSKLLLMYMKAEDDTTRSLIDSVFLLCSQLIQNYYNPRSVIILMKYLINDLRRLGVTVDHETVKKIVEIADELIS
ncbi:MAG: hypothetical protein QXT64_02710 [Desulfurococcaceae archaeon]